MSIYKDYKGIILLIILLITPTPKPRNQTLRTDLRILQYALYMIILYYSKIGL